MLLRALVLLLLAMNVGVAAWWALRPPPTPAVSEPAVDPDVPPLVLLADRERGPEAQVAEEVGPPEPIDQRAPQQCVEIGPLLTQADLRRAMSALTPLAERIQFRETSAVVRRGFRVFLPAPSTREAALAEARGLFGKGIRDYYVVTAGEEENTISFGLYRSESNALTRQQEILGFGVEAQVEPRNENIPQYWIDLDVDAGTDWRAALGGYSGVASREIPCD